MFQKHLLQYYDIIEPKVTEFYLQDNLRTADIQFFYEN